MTVSGSHRDFASFKETGFVLTIGEAANRKAGKPARISKNTPDRLVMVSRVAFFAVAWKFHHEPRIFPL